MALPKMNKRDLLSFEPLSRQELEAIFRLARDLKREQRQGMRHPLLAGKGLALLFEKPSLRTRVTFEVGMKPVFRLIEGYALWAL